MKILKKYLACQQEFWCFLILTAQVIHSFYQPKQATTSTRRYKQMWYKQQVHVHNTLHLTFSLRMTIVKEKCDKNKNIANLTHALTTTSKIKTAQQNKMSNKLFYCHMLYSFLPKNRAVLFFIIQSVAKFVEERKRMFVH